MEDIKVINVELVKGSSNDYTIKDKNYIIIGRFTITDLDKDNKKCNVKLKFYKKNDYNLLVESIKSILRAIFKDSNIHKANFFVYENINIGAFLDLGFTLEGIFAENLIVNGQFIDELSFGINKQEYNDALRYQQIFIKGKEIEIKNLTPENASELCEYYINNKKHLEKYEPSRDNSFYTEDAQRSILIEGYRQYMNGTAVDFGIYQDEKLIGKAKLSNIVYGSFKNGILGYSIDEKYQGKGYMKEAVKLILNYSKKELELHRIEASVLVDNEKSKRVLLGTGFQEVGINKKYLFINGQWRDHITFYKII